MIKIVMDNKTRKYNSPNHENLPQNFGRHSEDVGDSTMPEDQSSSTETFHSNSNVSLKYHRDDHMPLFDVTQPLPEGKSFLPSSDPTACLSLSGSVSETDALIVEPDATGYESLELGDKVSRTEEYDLSSCSLTNITAVGGGRDTVFEGADNRLMLQINSLLRDTEFIVPYGLKLAGELKHFDGNVPEPNLKPELEPEMSAADTGNVTLPYNNANLEVCQSQDTEKLSLVESFCDLAEADFFIENENVENILKLLHCLKEICCRICCCKHESQQHVCLKKLQQNEDNLQIGQDRLDVEDNQCNTSSVQTTVYHSEDSLQTTKEEIQQLMLSITKALEIKQFSSAVELTWFLEGVEQMKGEIDQWCCSQNKTKTTSSKDIEDPTALDSTTGSARSLIDVIAVLRTKASQIMAYFSKSLVLWQDFIEIRAELKYELTRELSLLNSIQTNITYNNTAQTKLEAEHDLKLVEDKLDEYGDELSSLRKCNRQLAELLDGSMRDSNLAHTGILANELQDIKDSCSKLRSMLNPASSSGKMIHTTQIINEKKNSFHSSCNPVEKSAEDFDKLPIARILLKMAMLLFLIVLLFLFVDVFEPYWYRPLNRFRLPVPVHLRHVGTYPPT